MLKIISEITDDIDKTRVDKISDYAAITELHNTWFKKDNSSCLNGFTENLIRDLLIRSPITEFEFRQINQDGFILCPHPFYITGCATIANIKRVIELAGSYEKGLMAVFNIIFPDKDIDYKREKHTHINISPSSTSKEGAELWSFLSDNFKLLYSSEYVSILDLANSGTVINSTTSPECSNASELIRLIEEKVRSNADIRDLLLYNQLPFSMYETTYTRGTVGIKVDIYNMWLPYLFDSIAWKLNEEKDITACRVV